MCPFLFWLQAALCAEVFPADTTTYRRVELTSCQRGKIRTPYAVTVDGCTSDRQTFHRQPLPRRRQVQCEMIPYLDECVRTAVEFSKDVVDV